MFEDSRKMIDTKGTRSFEVDSNPNREGEVDSAHPQIKNFKGGVKMAKSSNLQASFTLFKTFLGTGVLALPYAFKTAGMGLAILVVIFVSLITTLAFFLLLDVAEDKGGDKQMSLQKLTLEVLGDRGKHAVQASMMIMQLGCCIGVLIFVRTFLNHVLCEFEVESLCDNVPFNLFLAIILAVPLCMINNLHYFYIPALAANFFIIIGLTSQMFYNVETLKSASGTGPTFGERLGEFNWTSLPLFFGIATYAFEGVGVIFSIRSSMEKPEDFPFLLKNQMVILTIIYIVFPVVSYMAIGDNIQDVVFFSLPTDDRFYLLIQILYAMSALFTFPIQLFPALRIIENSRALRYRLFNEKGKTKNKKLRYGIRLLVIACVFFVAYVANSFHLFLNLLGSCVFTFLGFVLPIWLYHKQFAGRIKPGTKIFNMIILVIVTFFGATGFVMSIIKMATLGDTDSE